MILGAKFGESCYKNMLTERFWVFKKISLRKKDVEQSQNERVSEIQSKNKIR